jgi:hypothetical protein
VKSQSGGDHHDALGREISTFMRVGETQGGRGESSMTCLTYRDSKILDTSADACALFAVTRLFVFRARWPAV